MLVHKGYITTPPPIVSRVYQELSNGMEGFMDAYSLAVVPIPLPIRDTALCAQEMERFILTFYRVQCRPSTSTVFKCARNIVSCI